MTTDLQHINLELEAKIDQLDMPFPPGSSSRVAYGCLLSCI